MHQGIPSSGQISFYDFYQDPAPSFPVDNPDLIFVLDPMKYSSAINSSLNSSPGFSNASLHGYDTPLDTGGWYTGSGSGASWEAGSSYRPPHLYFSTSTNYFTSANTLYPSSTGAFTIFGIWNGYYSGRGTGWKRPFIYAGRNSMTDKYYGWGGGSNEYDNMILFESGSYLEPYNNGNYWNQSKSLGPSIFICTWVNGSQVFKIGSSYSTDVSYWPTTPLITSSSSFSTQSRNLYQTSGPGRPIFAGNNYWAGSHEWRLMLLGMAQRVWTQSEMNDFIDWVNGIWFAGNTSW